MDKRRVGKIAAFESAREFEQWLAKNHAESTGIWLRFFKKNSSVLSVSYDEALDAAICFGWIDGQLKKHDEKSWLRKFTPRRPKSVWSKRNRAHAERLITGGKMQAAGLQEVEAAKQDGRWNREKSVKSIHGTSTNFTAPGILSHWTRQPHQGLGE